MNFTQRKESSHRGGGESLSFDYQNAVVDCTPQFGAKARYDESSQAALLWCDDGSLPVPHMLQHQSWTIQWWHHGHEKLLAAHDFCSPKAYPAAAYLMFLAPFNNSYERERTWGWVTWFLLSYSPNTCEIRFGLRAWESRIEKNFKRLKDSDRTI